ncbi:MAG TPA: site-specific DNA-methyltransferase, partial [Anaerolineales bacterium]|nr:site-specific DNA-methyltransferase [Anaerolineales bacterium]
MFPEKKQLTIQEASKWASVYLEREITTSNISYLVQYGRIKKTKSNNSLFVSKEDLIKYYASENESQEKKWKKELGDDLNWTLSFENYRETERTKHVHRLHPYKGKFIPQLVEYFLDQHTDQFKQEVFFKPDDIILDPFCGSGTTMVQANELGIHALGIDISRFNALISNIKSGEHDARALVRETSKITTALKNFVNEKKNGIFERELTQALSEFNNEHFPSPDFRYKVRQGEINQFQYGKEKLGEFLPIYYDLLEKHQIQV